MIPADHITFDGDMAWWVLGPWTQDDSPPIRQLDRLCDTCNGAGQVPFGLPSNGPERCPDCINGRHTFKIEVQWPVCEPECSVIHPGKTYQVSIAPGMVLPIVERHPFGPMTHADGYVLYLPDGTGQLWQTPARNDGAIIALPPAAKPGMWAVKLRVAS